MVAVARHEPEVARHLAVVGSPSVWQRVRSLFSARPSTPTGPEDKPRPRILGGAGTSVYAGRIEELDPNSDVQGAKWFGDSSQTGVAQQMMRDGHVRRAVDAIVGPLVNADWDFDAASAEPIDLEIADACRWAFFECLPWHRFLRSTFTAENRDGAVLVELTDDVVPFPARFKLHPGRGRGIAPTGAHLRPISTVNEWRQRADDATQLAEIVQWIDGSDVEAAGERRIPADRLLRFTWDQEGANFAGHAPLRAAYGAWKLKILFLIIDGIRHERQGVGTPCIVMGEGPESELKAERQKAEEILAEMRAHEKGYIVLPNGWTFEWKTAGSVDTAIGEAIERCNRDIAHPFGVAHLLLGHQGRTGSFALATTQQGQQHAIVEGQARFFVDVMNYGSDGWSPIERFVRINYGSTASVPRLVARNLPTKDWASVLPILHNLVTSGVIVADERLEDFVRKVMCVTQRDPKTARPSASPVLTMRTPHDRDADATAMIGALERAGIVLQRAA